MKVAKHIATAATVICITLGAVYTYGYYMSKGYDRLQEAAKANDIATASKLMSYGVPTYPTETIINFDYFSHLEHTPIQIAAENGQLEMVKLLVANDTIIDWCCCECITALDLAMINKHKNIVEFLIELGARVNPEFEAKYNAYNK